LKKFLSFLRRTGFESKIHKRLKRPEKTEKYVDLTGALISGSDLRRNSRKTWAKEEAKEWTRTRRTKWKERSDSWRSDGTWTKRSERVRKAKAVHLLVPRGLPTNHWWSAPVTSTRLLDNMKYGAVS
jgi:hypothetical protein